MTIRIATLSAGIVTVALSAFAAEPDVSKLPPAAAQKGVTYDKDIKPIFEKACFKCHGPEKQKGKYRTDTLEATLKGGESGDKPVVVGNSAKSPLVHYVGYLVEDMEMPPPGKDGKPAKLTNEQIALIRAWIDQGAK
ncbi:MAG TPA: c-type cytochrome domain-containing protein [Methylomirabilota bacterium]|nr:c-type cytochrome domain-containing protein [Methylomirabilota bacterium]